MAFAWMVYAVYAESIKVTAVFDDLDIYSKNLKVVFKGVKLGRTIKMYLSDNGETTIVVMRIKLRSLKLPDNVYAKLRVRNEKEYIEIVYPKTPSEVLLHDDDVILGKKGLSVISYINSQAESGSIDELKERLFDTIISAGGMLNALTDLIITGNTMLSDMRPSLKICSKNLENVTKNLEYTTKKIAKSTDSDKLASSTFNIEQTTKNIETATKNLDVAAKNIADLTCLAKTETISLIDSTMENVNKSSENLKFVMKQLNFTIKNTDDIVVGLKNTLSSRFSGMKIMFGKAID